MPAAASLPLPQLVLRRVVCQHAYDASSSLSSARSPLAQKVCPHNAASAWQWLVLRRVWVALAKACPAPKFASRLGGSAMPHHSAPQGDRLCGRLAATKLHTQVTPRLPLSPWRVPTDRRLHNLRNEKQPVRPRILAHQTAWSNGRALADTKAWTADSPQLLPYPKA